MHRGNTYDKLRYQRCDCSIEKVGRKQQYYAELLGFGVAFVMVAIFAKGYFNQGRLVPNLDAAEVPFSSFLNKIRAHCNKEIIPAPIIAP